MDNDVALPKDEDEMVFFVFLAFIGMGVFREGGRGAPGWSGVSNTFHGEHVIMTMTTKSEANRSFGGGG